MSTVIEERPLNVVAVSGSLQSPSKTTVLVNGILAAVERERATESHLIEVEKIGPALAGALRRDELPASVEAELARIEGADLLIVATPVYRASFTGLFKHLFDFVGQYALIDKPVLIAATGGGATGTRSSSSTKFARCSASSRPSPCRSGSTQTTPISPNTRSRARSSTPGSTWPSVAHCRC